MTSGEKGRKFEDWVVGKFRPAYFSIKEWRGDKQVAVISAESSLLPDLEVELGLGDASVGHLARYRKVNLKAGFSDDTEGPELR